MRLSAPSFAVFLISTLLIGLIIGAKYFDMDLPIVTTIAQVHTFEVTLAAWFLLFMGVAFDL